MTDFNRNQSTDPTDVLDLVTIYDANGRPDAAASEEANREILAEPNNVRQAGTSVLNTTATKTARKASRAAILARRK